MTFRLYSLLYFFIALGIGCQEGAEETISKNASQKKQKDVFDDVSNHWQFTPKTLNPEAQVYLSNWEEWRVFNEEVSKKPVATISAFQKKSKSLTEKVAALETTLPEFYQKQEIKARLKVMMSHFQALEMYIHLDNIPIKKVKYYLDEINKEWQSITDKMNEIQYKSVIPNEEGEVLLLQKNDTLTKK
jgi:hypothetical protein